MKGKKGKRKREREREREREGGRERGRERERISLFHHQWVLLKHFNNYTDIKFLKFDLVFDLASTCVKITLILGEQF